MSHKAFLRARRPEHKQQRREAILDAARKLALESGVRTVSLGGVATAVGLVKSNLARYFATREEIFLELTTLEWRDWAHAVTTRLDAGDDVIDVLAETLAERPLFCDLMSQSATHLEHNVTIEAARSFKLGVLGVVADLGTAIARVDPKLTEAEARDLAAVASGLAGMLYPAANPPPVLAELYASDPVLAAACIPFVPTMKRALAAFAAGLPTLR
ncbi:TetR/AcrR family transcriptional regulator [Amycolatopsis sp. GM8]|uniref:TetR/AcrR family transcriptional regulator n=1 Tax=Amycolatopsis sp. GM8 TaxID=2896530 RepID=UPI001F337AAA|nr:TetR/AcrR family transcriptional regulator [Amycolatopsis sp. GM8]